MQNFEFLRKNGMFERIQSLFMMKPLFIKIFRVYKIFSVYVLSADWNGTWYTFKKTW